MYIASLIIQARYLRYAHRTRLCFLYYWYEMVAAAAHKALRNARFRRQPVILALPVARPPCQLQYVYRSTRHALPHKISKTSTANEMLFIKL